ncbi:hypothetical protein ILYODFUR_009896 [Ilyodon furcidens]|uniref:Uncharacterized protein n=1 Tax=Ilyodon furcidens TaxID=33524 RepID=A0ABV0U4J0_9TELE
MNHNIFFKSHNRCRVQSDGQWLISATGGLYCTQQQHVSSVRLNHLAFYAVSVMRHWLETSKRRDMKQRDTNGLPFSFNSFDSSKGLQSLLFKCFFLHITIHTVARFIDISRLQ